MSDFTHLAGPWQVLLCLIGLLAVFLYVYALLRHHELGRKIMLLPDALLLLISFAHVQLMIRSVIVKPFYPEGRRLLTVPVIITCLVLVAIAAFLLWRIGRWSRSHISAMSVKVAFDRLPTGLCYYLPGGLIKLVNASMDALCLETLGTPLMDPEGFWRGLKDGSLPQTLHGGETPMLRLADGRVFSFAHRVLDTELGVVHELLAMDVSDDYALNRELEGKQVRAKELNVRLKALLGSIEYLTMSRELMQLKTELHDALGQSLLLSKRYLLDPDSVDAQQVRDTWLNNLNLLENSRPESWQKPYFIQEKQAEALGVRLEIRGELPTETRLIGVVETSLRVHSTNVLRHAGGSRATVECVRDTGGWLLTLTNDGCAPSGEIREGGGLGNLRNRVEALGGWMKIESAPVFRLRIWLPSGDTEAL